MNPNQVRAEEIFDAAREIASTEERAAYLARACGEDVVLRKRIEGMLGDDEKAREYFDTERPNSSQAPASGDPTEVVPLSERPGMTIGRYKLREKIGEGGCGVVYVADQEEPVRRRVALKIIKMGMDTQSVVARFEAERQALAMMDHPNIAKVIDAGTTETGRPYFVMELVRGVKLTDYCHQHDLTVADRLDLFVKICRAVQHAHQKGIIHRDLKPSNILVTLHDGVPVPKIIDFGIAKATEGRLTDITIYTQLHQFIGTPAYMSPEQAEMSGLDIDTRSDVYSLGVLLYELLTGQTPFDPKDLLQAGLDELRRKIREDEPLRPSTRLSTMLDADLTTVAKHYAAEPPKLINLVRGDLDWIVMKALEKDRTRRYETANGMAMDIERFLHSEPVLARPPSQLYRLQKFARRNRAAFAGAAAVSAALLAGLVVSSWQAIRATRAQRSEERARLAADASRTRESRERQVAEDNAHRATQSERDTRRLLYAADMKLAHNAWEEGNLSRMTSLLEAHRPKPGEADPRGFEYYYLQELAKGEQEQVWLGHSNSVLSVVVSPDGKWLASRGVTDLCLWDFTRRSLAAEWTAGSADQLERSGATISFSYDSRYLAFPSPQGLEFYDLLTRQSRRFQSETISKPLFSPVTNLIAFNSGRAGGKITVWDYVGRKEVGVAGPNRMIWGWAPDGSQLLAGVGNGTSSLLEWWNVPGLNLAETGNAAQYIFGAAVSPDGRLIAAADWQGEIWLLATHGGNKLGTMDCGDIRTSALAFSPDGRFLATASRDQAVLIWNLESRQRVRQLRGHHAKVTSLAYTPDGQTLVSGDQDGKILLWDMAREARRIQIANRLPGFGLNPPQFSPDGKLLALVTGGSECSILDTSTLQPQSSIAGQFVAFSPDSRQAVFIPAGMTQPVLRVAKVGAPSHRATIPLATVAFTQGTPAISPDGRFLTIHAGANEESTLLFNAATGERLLSVPSSWSVLCPSRFLPDGRSWVCSVESAAGSAVGFWDLDSMQQTRTLSCGKPLNSLAVSPNGRFLAASREDLKILLWDLNSAGAPIVLTGHQAPVWALAFSSDGRTLASGSEDRSLKLWDLAARREIASFVQEKPVYWLAFSPDDQMLVWGGIGAYQVWRAPRGESSVASGSSQPRAVDPSATGIWRVPDGEAPAPSQIEAEKSLCLTNLLKIYAALRAYQKDHKQMPDWISDLVPQYLPDTNILLCPTHIAGQAPPTWLPTDDPKVRTSYSYEFCGRPSPFSGPYVLAAPGDTMKEWKTKQLERYGGVVPVLRCAEHGAMLNVSYAGELSEGGQAWEHAADVRWRAENPTAAEQWYHKMEQESSALVLNGLAWRWSTSADAAERDGRAAVRFAERAVDLSHRTDPDQMDTLAAAYAEAGQFDKALTVLQEAISLLNSLPDNPNTPDKLKDFQGRLELYGRQRPYRE